jgi:hypothetical protein
MNSRRRISALQRFVGKPIAIRGVLEPVLSTGTLQPRLHEPIMGHVDQEIAMPEPVTVFTPPKNPVVNQAPAVVERNTAPVRSATAVDGTQSSPDISPAQARWADQQARIRAADPWSDPGVVITKDPVSGALSAKPRTDGGANGVPVPDAGGQPQRGPAAVGADGKLVVGDLTLSADDIKSILAEKAARDSRAANRPADAGGYSLDLPGDFELPPGIAEWRWNVDDPTTAALLGSAKEWAFANGLDQPAFSKLLGIYAGHQITEERRFSEAKAAEVGKLGTNAAGRVDAVNTWLESQVGSQLAHELRRTMVTAGQVKAYEQLMRNFVSQGVSGNPGAGRDGAHNQPPKVDQTTYDRMSYAEKQAYAAQFAQPHGG